VIRTARYNVTGREDIFLKTATDSSGPPSAEYNFATDATDATDQHRCFLKVGPELQLDTWDSDRNNICNNICVHLCNLWPGCMGLWPL